MSRVDQNRHNNTQKTFILKSKMTSCLFFFKGLVSDLTPLLKIFPEKFCNVLAASPTQTTATEQEDKYLSHSRSDSSTLSLVFLLMPNRQLFAVNCEYELKKIWEIISCTQTPSTV